MRRLTVILALAALAVASPASASVERTPVKGGVIEFSVKPDAARSVVLACKVASVQFTRTNGGPGPLGNDLWKYRQEQGFCWNGRRVTSLYGYRREAICCDPGWQFKGHVGPVSTTGWAGQWSVKRRTQGHFAFCPPLIGCLDHDYPQLTLTVYGNGAVTKSASNH